MANAIRSAKSGSDWTANELLAYNIAVSPVAPQDFFPVPDPPLNHIDPAILTAPPGATDPAISDPASEYLGYLELAANATQESFIDTFAAETLKLLGFAERGTIVTTRFAIPLTICADDTHTAPTGACLLSRPSLVLLVLAQDKTLSNRTNAEAQAVAGAIAAFQYNNHKRKSHGLATLDRMTVPCIAMSGTRPAFYLVPVTTDLSEAVITGRYPAAQTRVRECATVHVATHTWCLGTGMEDTEYRKLALRRFLAFKGLAKSYWVDVLAGF